MTVKDIKYVNKTELFKEVKCDWVNWFLNTFLCFPEDLICAIGEIDQLGMFGTGINIKPISWT